MLEECTASSAFADSYAILAAFAFASITVYDVFAVDTVDACSAEAEMMEAGTSEVAIAEAGIAESGTTEAGIAES